jgi:hypothetical protein
MQIGIGLSLARPFPIAKAGFSPTNIAGLQLWFDASDSSTITQSGGSVSRWADKSGNGHDATQSSGAAKPGYSGGFLTFNGSQYLGLPSFTYAAAVSIYAVLNTVNTTQTNYSAILDANYGSNFMFCFNNNQLYMLIDNNFSGPFVAYPPTGNTLMSYCGGSQLLAVDASSATFTGAPAGTGASYAGSIGSFGGGDNIVANIAEIVCYGANLNSLQDAQVKSYLKAKWATP